MSNVFANDVSADLKIDIQLLFKCLHPSIQIDCATCVCMYLFTYHFVCVCVVSCTLDVHVLTSLSFLDHVSDVLFCVFAHTYICTLTKHAYKNM